MAWASSGGYPGVVSDGNGGITAAGALSALSVLIRSNGNLTIKNSGGVQVAVLTAATGHGQLFLDRGAGLFGHNAPATATAGGAHTAGGTYTSTEQAMLEAVYTALQSIGLVT